MQKYPILTFQQDNASAHWARATQKELLVQGIIQMFWPASSPDLNPIKNIWQILKEHILRRLRSKNRLHSVYELQQQVQEEWNTLTLEGFRRHIDSMLERMEAVIKNNG
jgi:transposase